MQSRQPLNASSSKSLKAQEINQQADEAVEQSSSTALLSSALPAAALHSENRQDFRQNNVINKGDEKVSIDSLKNELSNGLEENDLKDIDELINEIEHKKKLIVELQAKGKTKTSKLEKDKLEKLEHLQALAKKITEFDASHHDKEVNEKLEVLKKELAQGLDEYEIQGIDELVAEIVKKKNLITELQAKGKIKTVNSEMVQLKNMEHLLALSEKLNNLEGVKNNKHQKEQIDIWQKELEEGLQELEINDGAELKSEIFDRKKSIAENQAKGKLKTAESEKILLEKMERLQIIAQNIEVSQKEKSPSNEHANSVAALTPPYENKNAFNAVIAKLETCLMPPCLEQSLIKLSIYMQLRIAKLENVDLKTGSIVIAQEIEKEIESLKSFLIEEGKDALLTEDDVIKIHQKIKNEALVDAKTDIEKFLKKLRPFDIQEMLRLVDRANEAVHCVKDQDIVLLLGGTGAGKSTTIHFLAGSTMVETTLNELSHIAPVDIKNPALKNVNTSPSAVSETKFITAVPIKFKEMGVLADGGIVLCDTPGFEDTNGPEMDVANGIGIVKAVKGCKSIRPLVLISYMSIGDRFSGLKELAHTLVGIFPNFKDYIKTFTFAFTKFSGKSAEIHRRLEDVINHLSDEEKADAAFLALFNDMLKKTKRNVNIIDPVKRKPSPSDLLGELIDAEAINHPEEVIHFATTEKSKAAIQEQVRRHQLAIMSAVNRLKYDLAKYKLDELRALYETLKQGSIKQVYDECIRYLSRNVTDIYTNATNLINEGLEAGNVLTENDIKRYKKAINHVRNSEILREKHLEKEVIQSSACFQYIELKALNIVAKIEKIDPEKIDFSDGWLKICFDNLFLLANSFDHLKIYYQKAWVSLRTKLDNLIELSKRVIAENDFTQFATHMTSLKAVMGKLNTHVDYSALEKSYMVLKEYAFSYFTQQVSKAESILDQGKLENKEIDSLNGMANILEAAKTNLLLHTHIPAVQINDIYETFLGKIQTHFEEMNKKITNLFAQNGRENSFQEIEGLMKQLSTIRTISGVETRTSRLYYSAVDMVCGQVHQSRKEAEETLIRYTQQKEGVDYARLARYMAVFRNARWIDDYRPGVYSNLIQNLEEVIIQHILELQEAINHVDLDLENADKIEGAYKIILQSNQLSYLEHAMPILAQYRTNIVSCFDQKIKDVYETIKNMFNLEKKDIQQERNILKKLEQIKVNYDKLHQALLYLGSQNYNSVEEVAAEIKEQTEILSACELKFARIIEQENTTLNNVKQLAIDYDRTASHEKQDFLKKNKYQNIREIEADIQVKYHQLVKYKSDYEKESRAIQQELNKLQEIQKKYVKLLSKKEISPEAKSLLTEHGFDNDITLDAEITRRRHKVSAGERQNQAHLFDKIDSKNAEKALVYLNASKKIVALKKETERARHYLEDYLKQYVIHVENEMNHAFNNTVQPFQDKVQDDSYELSNNGYLLASRLQELVGLNESCPNVFSYFPQQIIEKWQAKLSAYVIELADEMRKLVEMGDGQNLKTKIKIAKSLNALDNFIKGKKFIDIYYEYQNIIYSYTKEITTQLLADLRNHNYSAVASVLDNLHQFKEVTNQNSRQLIKRPLQETIDMLIEDTKRKAIQLSGCLEKNEVAVIVENLKRVCQARQYVFPYIDAEYQARLKECREYVSEIVSAKVFEYISTIEAAIDSNNFDEAEKKLDVVSLIRRLLEDYCTKEVVDKIDDVHKKIGIAVNKIVEIYINMDIEQYPFNPPKEIMSKFSEINHRNQRYSQANSKIKEHIIRKFRDEFAKAKGNFNYHIVNQHLIKVESAIKSLPIELRDALMSELTSCKESIDKDKQAFEFTLSTTVASGDVEAIKQLIEDFKQKGMLSYVKKIEECIFQQAREYKIKIDDGFARNEFMSVYNDLYKLISYKIAFEEKVLGVKAFTTEVAAQISKVINTAYSAVSNGAVIHDAHKLSSDSLIAVEKNFLILIAFVDMRNAFKNKLFAKEVFSDECDNKINSFFENMYKSCADVQKKCDHHISAMEFTAVKDLLGRLRKCEPLLRKIREYSELLQNTEGFHFDINKSIKELKSYAELAKYVGLVVKNIKDDVVNIDLIGNTVKKNEKQREAFYVELAAKLNALKQAKELYDFNEITDLVNVNTLENECIKALSCKIEKLYESSEKILDKVELKREDFDNFNLNYNNLISFNKHVCVFNLDVDKVLEKINSKLHKKIQIIEHHLLSSLDNIQAIADSLISLKYMADNIIAFNQIINNAIDELLKTYRAKQGGAAITKLGVLLNKDTRGIGQTILAEHNCFKGYSVSLFNNKTQKHGLKYVLDNITSDPNDLNINVLAKRFDEFDKEYKALVQKHLDPKNLRLDELISNLKILAGSNTHSSQSIEWDAVIQDKIPRLMAYIFALWTLKNAHHYFDAQGVDSKESYLLQPHAAQVISIFRMLGIGDTEPGYLGGLLPPRLSKSLKNNLVQIGTGEGKSVTLAVTACVLGLLGIDVMCACYSDYLSDRDYSEFKSIFDSLGLLDNIHYGTFNKLFEKVINERGDVRKLVENIIRNTHANLVVSSSKTSRPKVLLIDEVDVFFNKDFYGCLYTPQATLKDPTIKSLIDIIWNTRKSKINLNQVKATPEYKACCETYKGWEFLIEEAVKDMLADIKTFETHDYIALEDKIGYKEQDGISYKITYGYKTLFAYYHEHAIGKISQKSLEDNIGIGINCGNFSYAEVPHEFQCIMGVTGTLKTLSAPERNIVQDVYHINKNTYAPSVFGKNSLSFRENADIKIENQDDYFNSISLEIDNRLAGVTAGAKRAVIVFFETKHKLMEFYNSPAFSTKKDAALVMTEELSAKEKDSYVKRATTSEQVTLATKVFGRGTDFVCRDQTVSANGGVHIISTFLSEEISEETQIKGRTARQGDLGSFSMVLLDKDLEKFLITALDITEMKSSGMYYAKLNEKRNIFFKEQYANNIKHVKDTRTEHQQAQQLLDSIFKGNIAYIKSFLGVRNKGASSSVQSRTLCLMDATGSMSNLLLKSKTTVGNMFERAGTVLKKNNIDPNSFEIQFAVYRNYNCHEDMLLQFSPWVTKPDDLRKFMANINVDGGMGAEAIEIGLWHANKEYENEEINQVILIGDAPANSAAEVTQKRKYFNESYWSATKFATPTFYKDEIHKLKSRRVPVHAFFVAQDAKQNFQEIAAQTGGRCEELDINSPAGAEQLTNLVTEEVLRNIGGAEKGNLLVEEYRSRFVTKSYKS